MTQRTSTEAVKAEANHRRGQGHEVTQQWHEEIGDWYLVRVDGQPREVICERDGRAYAERLPKDINPYTFVDTLLDSTIEGRRIH